MKKFLLICCSGAKNRFYETLPAKDMYAGNLTRGGLRYAEENGLEPLILSAKYGFITPDTVIKRYDQRFTNTSPYSGLFPEGDGFYLGGPAYFKNVPSTFKPLLPPALPLGKMTQALFDLLRNKTLDYVPRKQKVFGKTWYLYQWLLDAKDIGGITKEEAFQKLEVQFGKDPTMMQTVVTQFRQGRVGDERGCNFCSDGNGKFWLEPKPGILLSK